MTDPATTSAQPSTEVVKLADDETITDAGELSAWAHYQPAPCTASEMRLQRKALLAGYRAALSNTRPKP